MNRVVIKSSLIFSLFLLIGCTNLNMLNRDVLNNSSSSDGSSMQDSNGNYDDSNHITGTVIVAEKHFQSLEELSNYYESMNSEYDDWFIIPDFSYQSSYSYYYYVKGVCSAKEYNEDPDNVEFITYSFAVLFIL